MISLEQLKKQAANAKQEKEEIKKKDRRKNLEENQKVYEKNKKVQESVKKRQEEVEKETEDIKRKRSAISSTFKNLVDQIKAEYEDIKKDPSNPLAYLFLKDEEGNITKNLDKKNILELEEVESKIPELKKTRQRKTVLKGQKEKLSKTKEKLEEQEKELYPKTKKALEKRYFMDKDFHSFLNDLKNPRLEYLPTLIGNLNIGNLKTLLKESPEQIENIKELFIEKIGRDFEKEKEEIPQYFGASKEWIKKEITKEYPDSIKELIQEYVSEDFDRQISIEKVREVYNKKEVLKALGENYWEGIGMDNVERHLNNIEEDFKKYKILLSNLKYAEEKWDSEKINLEQRISFKESHGFYPIDEESISKKEKYKEEVDKLSKELDQKKEELDILSKKNPLFGKSSHKNKIDKIEDELTSLKIRLNGQEVKVRTEGNNTLFNKGPFKEVLRELDGYFADKLGQEAISDIHKELLSIEKEGGILILRDYLDELKKLLFQIRDEQNNKKKDLAELIKVFGEYKENEKSSKLSEIRNKIIEHFS